MDTLLTIRRSIFWVSLPFGILGFVLPVYGQSIGADAVAIGLFFAAFSLMTVVLRPVVGAALDRYGRRPFFLLGLAGYAATMFAFAVMDQVAGIVLARILQGTASAFLWLSARAIVADAAPADDRGRSFGSVDQQSSRGAIIGVFVGFTVLFAVDDFATGWMILFAGYGLAALVALGISARRLPETNPAPGPAVQRSITWSRPWVLLLFVTAVTAASWSMVSPILIIFLQDSLQVGVTQLAWAYLPSALVWAFLATRLGALADRFGRKPLMVLGLVVAALSSVIIPGLSSLVGFAALWALQALCYAAGDPAEQALVADLTGGDQRGRGYGYYTLAAGLGATVGPLLGGWLYEAVSPAAPFLANGIVLAASAIVLGLLLRVPAPAVEGQATA